MKTTLNKIRQHKPCRDGWEKLLKHLGKTKPDDEPLSLLTILDSNGLDDALWCLRAVDGYDKEMRLYAVWCARQIQHFMTDQKSLDALDVAEKYAHGQATYEELKQARVAAWNAAFVTACVTARAAAWAAETAAAWDVARVTAWEAARAATWAAARDAAKVATWAAAQETEFKRMLNAIEDYAQCA